MRHVKRYGLSCQISVTVCDLENFELLHSISPLQDASTFAAARAKSIVGQNGRRVGVLLKSVTAYGRI